MFHDDPVNPEIILYILSKIFPITSVINLKLQQLPHSERILEETPCLDD